MQHAIEAKGLCKNYKNFSLKDVELLLPQGSIMGLIGDNGAGKTTTIKLLLGLVRKDGGSVKLLGKDAETELVEAKNMIGVVFDECCWPEQLCPKEVGAVLKNIYPNWQKEKYDEYIERFSLNKSAQIKGFSRGMKMKLSLAAALCVSPRLLLLDEPTGGLDPVVRNEVLDILQEFISDEENSVLLSSHITGDLEKICDYITFLHKGKVLLNDEKDKLLDKFFVVKSEREQLAAVKDNVIRLIPHQFGCDALITDDEGIKKALPQSVIEKATLEDIMLFYIKGEKI